MSTRTIPWTYEVPTHMAKRTFNLVIILTLEKTTRGAKFSILWTFGRFILEVLGEEVIIPCCGYPLMPDEEM